LFDVAAEQLLPNERTFEFRDKTIGKSGRSMGTQPLAEWFAKVTKIGSCLLQSERKFLSTKGDWRFANRFLAHSSVGPDQDIGAGHFDEWCGIMASPGTLADCDDTPPILPCLETAAAAGQDSPFSRDHGETTWKDARKMVKKRLPPTLTSFNRAAVVTVGREYR
jgi:hypothetical protein